MTSIDEMRKELKKRGAHKIPWYNLFLDYIEMEYYTPAPLEPIPLLRYHLLEKEWYLYDETKGVYNLLFRDEIVEIFYQWAKLEDPIFVTSSRSENHALKQLQIKVKTKCEWDSGHYEQYHSIENTIDGLLDRDTKTLLPHTPEYLSKFQVPRHYLPDQTEIPPELEKLYSATPDRDKLHKFNVGVVYWRTDMEMFLLCYGKRGSGKSTTLQIFEFMFGAQMISKTPLHKLGQRFGYSRCYDKRMNIYPDLAGKALTSDTVSSIKIMTGDEGGMLEVEKKGTKQFDYPAKCIHAFASNQCMKIAKQAVQETESVMRRGCLIHYPKAQPRDDAFKRHIRDPEVLDRIYSYLLNCQYEPLVTDATLEDWIQETNEKWMLDAEPVNRILHELYEFDDAILGHYEDGEAIYRVIACHEVVNEIQNGLTDEGFTPPNDLMADITRALKTMKIIQNTKRGKNKRYIWIKKQTQEDDTPEPEPNRFMGFDPLPEPIFDPEVHLDRLIADIQKMKWEAFELEDLEVFVTEYKLTALNLKAVIEAGVRKGVVYMEGSQYRVRETNAK